MVKAVAVHGRMLRRRSATAVLRACTCPWVRQLLPYRCTDTGRRAVHTGRCLLFPPVIAAARHDGQVEAAKQRAQRRSRASGLLSPAAAAAGGSLDSFPDSHSAYWTEHLKRCTRDGAQRMLCWIDTSNPLGVDSTRKGINTESKDSVYGVTLKAKQQFPTYVVLVRVGEFYEAMGYDAVMLVQHGGLNPMGSQPYRAGTPVVNLHSTLRCLTDAGFSVAVVEEAPEHVTYGQKPPAKQRILGGVVTPASPQYIYGAVSANAATEYDAIPILGLFTDTSGGFSLATVHTDLRSFTVLSGLPEASIVAFLRAMPTALLYVHRSLRRLPGMDTAASRTPLGGSKSHLGAALRNALAMHEGCVDAFDGNERNAVQDLLECVRRANNLPANTRFAQCALGDADSPPRPLALSTALSLGVVHSSNTPDLVTSLLPSTSPRAVVHTLRALLLCPPGERVSDALALALRRMSACDEAIPQLPLIPAAQVARLINAGECSAPMFRKLVLLCRRFLEFDDSAGSGKLRGIAEALLMPAALDSGVVMSVQELAGKCRRSVEAIQAVVAPDYGSFAVNESEQTQTDLGQLIGSRLNNVGSGDATPWPVDDSPVPQDNVLPLELFEYNERNFRGLVRRECTEDVRRALHKLEVATSELNLAVREDFVAVLKLSEKLTVAASVKKTSISYDYDNNAIWLKGQSKFDSAASHNLIHPRDRRGGQMDHTVWSTDRVEQAMEQYRQASRTAADAVFAALRSLSRALIDQQLLMGLVGVAAFSLWLRLASDHSNECFALRGWMLPQLVQRDKPWVVEGLTPPWLPRTGAGAAVANSFTCDGLFVLTGANMAGKSTIMRSAGACALLANCGLYVPADRAQVPRFKSYHVRMASSDNPLMSLSHWGLDMVEAIAAVEAANSLNRSACILLDELGQGTEVSHATAMAASLIRDLNASGCRGMFATHLHGVLPLVHSLPGITMKCMEITDGGPSWRMVDGTSTESLAFKVAEDLGMPQIITTVAKQYLQGVIIADPAIGIPQPRDGGSMQPERKRAPVSIAEVLAAQVAAAVPTDSHVWRKTFTVQEGRAAPPLHNRCAAVYAFEHDSRWYVGETVSLADRIQAHRSTYGKQLAFVYALVPDESKAKMVETNTQKELLASGWPLLSDADSAHKPVRETAR